VHFISDSSCVVSSSADGTVRFWDERAGQSLFAFHSPVAEFSSRGAELLLAGNNARLVHTANGSTALTLTGAPGSVRHAMFVPDSHRIALVDRHGTVTLWDPEANRAVATLSAGSEPRDARSYFSPTGASVLVARNDGITRVWNTQTGESREPFSSELFHATVVALSPDRSRIAAKMHDGSSVLIHGESGQVLARLGEEEAVISHAAFSPDGTILLTAGPDEAIKLWDPATGQLRDSIDEFATGLAFSPDGLRIAVALDEDSRGNGSRANRGFVRIWDVRTSRILATLDGHPGSITSLAFSADGMRVATGADDRSARIWDSHTGAMLAAVTGHSDDVNRVRFSPDGSLLCTQDADGNVFLFPGNAPAFLAAGCRLLRSQPEWGTVRRYCEASTSSRN
jgi:WD40 repeat protein